MIGLPRRKINIYRNCLNCGKKFLVPRRNPNKKYCNPQCWYKSGNVWNKGLTKETDKRIETYGKKQSKTKKNNLKYKEIGTKNLQNDKSIYSIKLEGKIDIKELKFFYDLGLSQHQLAKIYKCTQSSISLFMKRHNISNRGRKDGAYRRTLEGKRKAYEKVSKKMKGNKNWVGGLHKRGGFPNKDEKKLIRMFRDNNIPLRFVGNGTFFIEGKNPDFVNVKKKKVLEYDSTFWHDSRPEGYDRLRNEVYCRNGWDLLIVTDDELKDEKELIIKIKDWF